MRVSQVEIIIPEAVLSVDIPIVISKHRNIRDFAYILHDKDCCAPHYHIYLIFRWPGESFDALKDWFKLSKPLFNRVSVCENSMLLYLLQWHGKSRYKYEYSLDCLQTSFDVSSLIKRNVNVK